MLADPIREPFRLPVSLVPGVTKAVSIACMHFLWRAPCHGSQTDCRLLMLSRPKFTGPTARRAKGESDVTQ